MTTDLFMTVKELKELIANLSDDTFVASLSGSGSGQFAKPLKAKIAKCSINHNGYVKTVDATSSGKEFDVLVFGQV